MTEEQLGAVVKKVYSWFTVVDVTIDDPNLAAVVVMARTTRPGERRRERVFDPYTGKDLGEVSPNEPDFPDHAQTALLHQHGCIHEVTVLSNAYRSGIAAWLDRPLSHTSICLFRDPGDIARISNHVDSTEDTGCCGP